MIRKGGDALELWIPLFACVALAVAWYHALRLREYAVAYARDLCKQHGLQLLDESVALHRMRLQRLHGTLRVLREYRFEVSAGGNDRRTAGIAMVNSRVVRSSLPQPASQLPAASATPGAYSGGSAATMADAASGDNVVPIVRAHRTLH